MDASEEGGPGCVRVRVCVCVRVRMYERSTVTLLYSTGCISWARYISLPRGEANNNT